MSSSLIFEDLGTLIVILAIILVFLRWIWLQFRLGHPELFMTQIEKLVRANNTERALKLCMAIPDEPLSQGTRAVLKADLAGRKMNETELIEVFLEALPGGSISASLRFFRAFKNFSFFLALAALAGRVFGIIPGGSTFFWIATVAYFILFTSATSRAARIERGIAEGAGRLIKLLATPDKEKPGVDAKEEGDEARNRGEGHLGVREAWEDADARVDELSAPGIEDLLLATFRKEHGIDLRHDENAMTRIGDAAQKAVIELRSVRETQISLPFITADGSGPKHLEATVSRKKALVFARRARESTPAGKVPNFALSPSPAPSPSPSPTEARAFPPSLAEATPSGKAVVCRNCAAPIPVEPEVLATIEGEFDLWTKVKTRCPKCGGSFFELIK